MSRLTASKHPAYHLRPNKAIDRAIFIELLQAFDRYQPLTNHIYIGFGGPFLEDFRLVTREFPRMLMYSIESDGETSKRQVFHKCTRNMQFFNCAFEEFLSSKFPTDSPTITWADYTGFSRDNLLEISDIARQAIPFSVLRITVEAETPLYKELGLLPRKPLVMPSKKKVKFEEFIENFRQRVNLQDVSYDQDLFRWPSFTEVGFPVLLSKLIHSVITVACLHPKVYLPLHSVKYSDGTIMLSVTGLICLEQDRADIIEHFRSKSEFFSANYAAIETIDVPMLTTKERLHLECQHPVLSVNGNTAAALGYLVEGDDSKDLNRYKMTQYEKYHSLYPYFGRLIP